jgi:GNAT superfamily N-acetyltransferase
VTVEPITTWFLEMNSADELRPARPVDGFEVRRLDPPDVGLSRRLYERVGGPWHWTDRLAWGHSRWSAYLAHAETLVGYLDDGPVGYAELVREGADVELASFGLLPGYAGRGLGGALLAAATERAWESGAGRVWLHTCSLDSPAALPSYERRGFRRYDEKVGR